MTNFYHNSPTTKQIKQLKAQRANDMRIHINAMKQVTTKYATALAKLDKLRLMEIELASNIKQGIYTDEQIARIEAGMAKNRRAALRVFTKLTEVK